MGRVLWVVVFGRLYFCVFIEFVGYVIREAEVGSLGGVVFRVVI